MKNIHDRGYKKLFSNKTIFRQLIETFVPEAWVKEIDFEHCETLDKSFIADHYKATESDLIYKLKLRGQEAYIVILLEFQSTVDHFMALRVLNYLTNFYMDYAESHKQITKLPPVFPILLYNGDEAWTAPCKFSDLIEHHELLGKFAVHFEYFKIVEHEYPQEQLLRIHNIVSTLFLTEAYYDFDLLKAEFVAVFEREEDRQAISLLLNWYKQLLVAQKVEPVDYAALERHIYANVKEVRTMLETAIERDRTRLYQRGIEQGIKQGKIEDAKVMLARGMPVALIAEITGLTEDVILQLNFSTN